MDNINLLTYVLIAVLAIMIVLLIILGGIYLVNKIQNRKKEEKVKVKNADVNPQNGNRKKYKNYTIESINDFMEFDTIVDNMISQKDGKRYIMVVACQGINYDLMSEAEKNAVEESFIQFLNTIRYPIQIYTQTRTVNLNDSIQSYKKNIKEIEATLERQELNYNEMVRSESYTEAELNRAYFELTKRRNLYEYGKDIVYNTEKMSLNKNVLNQKYYVVIPYYLEDIEDTKYDEEEQRGLAFAELYTRAQTIIRTLSACGINGRVMTSNELVELLYMAYNRDEAEVYSIEKALKAGYDELYTTAPDVIDKQMRELNKEIEAEAVKKAKAKIAEVKSEKQKVLQEKRNKKLDLIDELAKLIIEKNVETLGDEVAEGAIEKIENEGGKRNETISKEKTNRTTKSK